MRIEVLRGHCEDVRCFAWHVVFADVPLSRINWEVECDQN